MKIALIFDIILKVLQKRITLSDARKTIINSVSNKKQKGKDMIAICFLAHGGPNKTIMFSDGKTIRLHELLNG